jgi:flagellar biogenesis protein FliO
MGASMIAFLFAIGGATWVYNKFMNTTGNNTKSAITISVIAFVFIFLIIWSALSLVIK